MPDSTPDGETATAMKITITDTSGGSPTQNSAEGDPNLDKEETSSRRGSMAAKLKLAGALSAGVGKKPSEEKKLPTNIDQKKLAGISERLLKEAAKNSPRSPRTGSTGEVDPNMPNLTTGI